MERTLRDDLMLILCFVVGATVGALVFGADAAFSEGAELDQAGAVATIRQTG